MAGKTTIDTDLRNELLTLLNNLNVDIETKAVVNDLYYRLKPQRTRSRKVVEDQSKQEQANGADIQPSQ